MKYSICFLLGILVAIVFCEWEAYTLNLPAVIAPPAKELAKVETELLECQKLLTYKPTAKKKLNLPDPVKADHDKHVVAASQVPPSDYPHTMMAVYDSGTGAVNMFLRRDPPPWLAFNRRAAIGVAYGFKDNADGFATMLYGRIDLIQVKRLHAGLLGNVDTAGGWYGGGFAELRL